MKRIVLYAALGLLAFVLVNKLVFYFTKKNLNNTSKLQAYSQINRQSKVFIGDSHVAYFPITEWFKGKDVLNSGVPGNTTVDVLQRIDSVAEKLPLSIFIQVGVNDILRAQPGTWDINNTLADYKEIIRLIQTGSPQTRIYIQGLMPVNEFYTGERQDSITASIIAMNTELRKIADQQHCFYTDLFSVLAEDNALPMSYSVDGLHLNGEGYTIWYNKIKRQVAD